MVKELKFNYTNRKWNSERRLPATATYIIFSDSYKITSSKQVLLTLILYGKTTQAGCKQIKLNTRMCIHLQLVEYIMNKLSR